MRIDIERIVIGLIWAALNGLLLLPGPSHADRQMVTVEYARLLKQAYTPHEDVMESRWENAAILDTVRDKDIERAVAALKQNIE